MTNMTSASEPSAGLRPGSVFGRYVLVERVGVGSMGEVWVAIDPDLDRKIALKLLRASRSGRRDEHERLLREARAMARLSHPNVATVHDVGEVEGRIFVAMEFVEGESLAEWIVERPHAWPEVLAVLRQAGEGLAAAHRAGLVHRDFKPANVLLGADGRVRVVDFGLAAASPRPKPIELDKQDRQGRVLRVRPRERDETDEDVPAAVGTPAYMSPEQHRGESFDQRSDLFAFCVTLFEALYGRRPFPGEHRFAVALAIVEGRLEDVPAGTQAPAWIHKAVLRGLSLDPAERFPDMEALLRVLARDPALIRKRRWVVASIFATAIGLAALAVWLRPEPPPDPCADAGAAMGATWTSQRRAALERWLEAGAGPRGSAPILAALDERASAWIAADRALCSDAEAGRTTERLLTERRLCLDRQQQAFAALVELPEVEATLSLAARERLLARPFAILRALGQVEACGQAAVPGSDQGPDTRASLERSLGRAELWLALEQPQQAEQELREHACVLGGDNLCPPALALLRGRLAALRGQQDEATKLLHHAAAGSTGRDPVLALRAWTELARLSDAEQRGIWIAYADALARDGQPRVVQIELALVAAEHELDSNLASAARRRLDAAIELSSGEPVAEPDLLARLYWLRARALRDAGELDAALVDEAEATRMSGRVTR